MAIGLPLLRESWMKLLTKWRCSITVLNLRKESSQSERSNEIIKKPTSNVTISKAMKAYLDRAEEEEKFLTTKITEYEIGKRHLANIMGRDPETFTQDDIDEAIEYLLPSALFIKEARPLMKHPDQVFPKRKAAEFDVSGRPYHPLFYTGKPQYYKLLQTIAIKADNLNKLLNKHLEAQLAENSFQYTLEGKTLNLESSRWLLKHEFERRLLETLNDKQFSFFITSMNRLTQHPLAYREESFIAMYRQNIVRKEDASLIVPELMYTDSGTPYMTATGQRKKCTSEVKVYGKGSGQITINGNDILYFTNPQEREQVLFPLQISKLLNEVDVVATCQGPEKSLSGQAGAVRYALAVALRSFVDEVTLEKMRIAGLLTCDKRKRERKKPGRRRARAKFKWKKR